MLMVGTYKTACAVKFLMKILLKTPLEILIKIWSVEM